MTVTAGRPARLSPRTRSTSMTSLMAEIAAMTPLSWARSLTSTVKWFSPLRSSVTVTSAFTMLAWREEIAVEMSARRPGRSRPMCTAIFTGSACWSATAHSTVTVRSLSMAPPARFGQSCACTVIPRPRVMKPTIGSPGTGPQHFAKRTSTSSTPLTETPPVSVRGRAGFAGFASVRASSGASGGRNRVTTVEAASLP